MAWRNKNFELFKSVKGNEERFILKNTKLIKDDLED